MTIEQRADFMLQTAATQRESFANQVIMLAADLKAAQMRIAELEAELEKKNDND